MRPVRRLLLGWLVATVVVGGGCARVAPDSAALTFDAIDLQVADNQRLRVEAERALKSYRVPTGAGGRALRLREAIAQDIEGTNSVGVIISYTVRYVLHYQLGGGQAQHIKYETVVSHDENRYHAGVAKRRQVVDNLRQKALRRLLLRLHT